MKKILFLVIVVALLVVAVTPVLANGATLLRADGCDIPDGIGNMFPVSGCSVQIVVNKNGYNLRAHGQLPEGAVLPDKAVKWTAQELGFDGCYQVGDVSQYVVTPSGRVNFTCHSAK